MRIADCCSEKWKRIKGWLETLDPCVASPIILLLLIGVIIGIIWVPQRMQAVFLLLAFAAAVYYAWHAKSQVEATLLLAGRATLFIIEPDDPHSAEHGQWLIFRTRNLGEKAAVNVDASAEWTRGPADRGVSPELLRPCKTGMAETLDDLKRELNKVDHKEPYKVWRHWHLCPDDDRFFGFPQPEKKDPQGQQIFHPLEVRWFDPNFVRWCSVVNVYWDDDDQRWSTNWDNATPHRL